MAVACPIDLDTRKLREEIQSIYARVATDPSGDFHFHRGPRYAAEFLNYDRAALDELPAENTASFAGVSNPHRIDPIAKGAIVVDIGCGAGMDLLLACGMVDVPAGKWVACRTGWARSPLSHPASRSTCFRRGHRTLWQ